MSRSDVPQWVRLACGRWGRQKRRIWEAGESYVNAENRARRHVDGYADSFMGRIKDERVAAGYGRFAQHWEEVFWGDGLDVQRAIVGMPVSNYDALHLKYVWNPEFNLTWPQRAGLIGMKERVFWDAVGRAEFWIFARLDPSVCADLLLRRESVKSIRNTKISLSKVSLPPPKIDLDLAALNRAKLTLAGQ